MLLWVPLFVWRDPVVCGYDETNDADAVKDSGSVIDLI